MKVSEQIKMRRQEMALTQDAVAKELHVSRQTISSWENARSYPDIEMLIQLSDFFSISLDQLLKGDTGMVEDIKRKTELKENRLMFWGSWGVNLALAVLFGLSSLHVRGFVLTVQQVLFLIAILVGNMIVLMTAMRKRTRLGLKAPLAQVKPVKFIPLGLAVVLGVLAFFPFANEFRFAF